MTAITNLSFAVLILVSVFAQNDGQNFGLPDLISRDDVMGSDVTLFQEDIVIIGDIIPKQRNQRTQPQGLLRIPLHPVPSVRLQLQEVDTPLKYVVTRNRYTTAESCPIPEPLSNYLDAQVSFFPFFFINVMVMIDVNCEYGAVLRGDHTGIPTAGVQSRV
jgi:hypothetical protein